MSAMNSIGKTDLTEILKTLQPKHNPGDYVFCSVSDSNKIDLADVIMFLKEGEGHSVIIKKELADRLHLDYTFVAAWITLSVHSSLAAVGLTAAFSKALSDNGISCNVVAAFYHDHIFVDKKGVDAAMNVLTQLSE